MTSLCYLEYRCVKYVQPFETSSHLFLSSFVLFCFLSFFFIFIFWGGGGTISFLLWHSYCVKEASLHHLTHNQTDKMLTWKLKKATTKGKQCIENKNTQEGHKEHSCERRLGLTHGKLTTKPCNNKVFLLNWPREGSNTKIVTPKLGSQRASNESIKCWTSIVVYLKYKANLQDRPNHSWCQKAEGLREFNVYPKTHMIIQKIHKDS